jgi:hypothetical protein
MRKGFSLITAIIIMMTVSLLMTMMVSLSNVTVKTTTDIYLKEQAELLARSATEYALLAVSGHDNHQSCIEKIDMLYPNAATPTHEMNVTLWYMGSGLANCGHLLDNNLSTPESNLTAIVDVVVTVDQNNTGITEPIRLHRRTLQKL